MSVAPLDSIAWRERGPRYEHADRHEVYRHKYYCARCDSFETPEHFTGAECGLTMPEHLYRHLRAHERANHARGERFQYREVPLKRASRAGHLFDGCADLAATAGNKPAMPTPMPAPEPLAERSCTGGGHVEQAE